MCDFETHLFTFSLTLSLSLSPAFSTLLVFHIIIVISLNSNGKQKAKKPKLTSRQKKTNKVVLYLYLPVNCSNPANLQMHSCFFPRFELVLVRKSRRLTQAADSAQFLIWCWWFRAKRNKTVARRNTNEDKASCAMKPEAKRSTLRRWSNEFLGNILQLLFEESQFSDLFYSFTMFS